MGLSLKLQHSQDGCILETSWPELHSLLFHLRQRGARSHEASGQSRSYEGRRVERETWCQKACMIFLRPGHGVHKLFPGGMRTPTPPHNVVTLDENEDWMTSRRAVGTGDLNEKKKNLSLICN